MGQGGPNEFWNSLINFFRDAPPAAVAQAAQNPAPVVAVLAPAFAPAPVAPPVPIALLASLNAGHQSEHAVTQLFNAAWALHNGAQVLSQPGQVATVAGLVSGIVTSIIGGGGGDHTERILGEVNHVVAVADAAGYDVTNPALHSDLAHVAIAYASDGHGSASGSRDQRDEDQWRGGGYMDTRTGVLGRGGMRSDG